MQLTVHCTFCLGPPCHAEADASLIRRGLQNFVGSAIGRTVLGGHVTLRAARNYRAPGTGLSPAICKEIIDRHGGRLTIDGEVGQGASFTMWLGPMQNG